MPSIKKKSKWRETVLPSFYPLPPSKLGKQKGRKFFSSLTPLPPSNTRENLVIFLGFTIPSISFQNTYFGGEIVRTFEVLPKLLSSLGLGPDRILETSIHFDKTFVCR